MHPERAPRAPREEAPKNEKPDVLDATHAAPERLRPDGREDMLGDEYRDERAEIVDQLAELKGPSAKDEVMAAYEKDLTRLSSELLDASATDPEAALQISEGVKELNVLMDEHREERKTRIRELESRLASVNDHLNPLRGMSEGETEKALSGITFAEPMTPEDAEKALEPLQEITEVTDDMIIRDEDQEKPPAERHGISPKGTLTSEQKKALREEDASRKRKKQTEPEMPPERVPGAKDASRAEYELTGDEFEIEDDAPGSPEPGKDNGARGAGPDIDLDALFANSKEGERSEVLPALPPEAQAARELGDEAAAREDVRKLEARISSLHAAGFSQENLDRLMNEKGIDPDKRAASGAYRARTKLRSLFDPKLRLLLEIYDKRTSELADLKGRLSTGQLRLKDPEAYRKMMKAQHKRIRGLRNR